MQKQSLPNRRTTRAVDVAEKDESQPGQVRSPSQRPAVLRGRSFTSLLRQPPRQAVRLGIMWALLAAMVAVIGVSILSLSSGVEIRAFEQHLNDASTESIDTTVLAQSFRSDFPNLDRVDLQAGS